MKIMKRILILHTYTFENEFTLTETFKTSAEKIYTSWLSTTGHSAMTGSPAKVDGTVNGDFTACGDSARKRLFDADHCHVLNPCPSGPTLETTRITRAGLFTLRGYTCSRSRSPAWPLPSPPPPSTASVST